MIAQIFAIEFNFTEQNFTVDKWLFEKVEAVSPVDSQLVHSIHQQ